MMNELKEFEKYMNIPDVEFDRESGELFISGKSVFSQADSFYKKIISIVNEYGESPAEKTTVLFRLAYFNTSSASSILQLMYAFEAIHKKNKLVEIIWQYDGQDEDMLEAGEDFRDMITIPVTLESVEMMA